MVLLNILPVELNKKVLGRIYFLKDEIHCAKQKNKQQQKILEILSMFITIYTHLFILHSLWVSLKYY